MRSPRIKARSGGCNVLGGKMKGVKKKYRKAAG